MANKTIVDLENDLVKPYIDKVKTAYKNNINTLGCKNLLPNRMLSEQSLGVTAIVNSDLTISLNGTATGVFLVGLLSGIREGTANQNKFSLKELGIDKTKKYVLSANSTTSDCNIRLYFYDSTKTQIGDAIGSGSSGVARFDFLTDYANTEYMEVNLYIKSGTNVGSTLLKPMICLESDYDLDPSYVPYGMPCTSAANLGFTRWDELAISGAVNLCPNNAVSQVINGITWTVNSDGTVTATGAVSSGESDSVLDIYVPSDGNDPFVGQPVRFSGCPTGGSDTTYRMFFSRVSTVDGSSGSISDIGYGINQVWRNDHSGTGAKVSCVIYPAAGTVNLTFKPMISPIGYRGDYVPYVAPNKTLTEKVKVVEKNKYKIPNNTKHLTIKTNTTGNVVHFFCNYGSFWFDYTGGNWRVLSKFLFNREPGTEPTITYSISGNTINLNFTQTVVGFMIDRDNDLEITVGTSSSPETNTLAKVNLYSLT